MMRVIVLTTVLLLAACDQSMQTQHHAKPNGSTRAWPGGAVARPVPGGTVAQGDAAYRDAIAHPPMVTSGLIARGRNRYDIFCAACHGYTGDGDGMVVQRGYPHPPSLNSAGARALDGPQIFHVISDGTGIMFAYAAQIDPKDRWAIVAYLRALQLSQHAPASALNGGEAIP